MPVVLMFLLMNLIIISAVAAAPWPGSGTEVDPYQIYDANDLYVLASDPCYYADNFILTADIDLAGRDGMDYIIAPDNDGTDGIYDGTGFTGTFDGNYHVIRNFTIDASDRNDDFLGLFGSIDLGAEVLNLGIEDAVITGGASPGVDSDNIGALAGDSTNGIIKYCYATGQINDANSMYIGGLIGLNGGEIYDCYADVDVIAGEDSQMVGGLAGANWAGIDKSYASGAVSGGSSVGAFAGDSSFILAQITDCYFLRLADGGGPDNGVGTDLTNTEMQQQGSFMNWDFLGEADNGADEVWQMSGYPVFNWQVPVGMEELLLLARYWLTPDCMTGQPCSVVNWSGDWAIDIDLKDFALLQAGWQEPMIAARALVPGDDFETGDFGYMPWVMGGDADWVIVSDITYEGGYAARSGTIGDSQVSSMEFTVDLTGTGYDYIEFYMKTSTEADADKLKFYDNGDGHGMFYGSGELDWTYFSFPIDAGIAHTFRWSYEKDSSGSSGSDSVWIDRIVLLDLY
jgi:hypothetical protein